MQTISIYYSGIQKHIPFDDTRRLTIKEFLQKQDIFLIAPCGGNGTCGKCIVYISSGNTRLPVCACNTIITSSLESITIPDTSLLGMDESVDYSISDRKSRANSTFAVAADVGTTTIEIQLLNPVNGHIIGSKKEYNKQIAFGSDVLSRVKAVMDESTQLELQSRLIQHQLKEMILSLCESMHLSYSCIDHIHISCNTIMEYLFFGKDPVPLVSNPKVALDSYDINQVCHLDVFEQAKLTYSPPISPYIGGDITAGLYHTIHNRKAGAFLYLDIGTNGEMALGTADRYTATSTATGPAFEGAGISCGMTGTTGAITHITWKEAACKMQIETIGNTIPQGICGSGMIDLIAILLDTDLLTASGTILSPNEARKKLSRLTYAKLRQALGYRFLEEDVNGNGIFYLRRNPDIYITTEDVRRIQLAKGAVGAGIELLMKEKQLTFDEIDYLFVAGNFGSHLNPVNAAKIGLIPEALLDRLTCVGNASLEGSVHALTDPKRITHMAELTAHADVISLADDQDFSSIFMNHIDF